MGIEDMANNTNEDMKYLSKLQGGDYCVIETLEGRYKTYKQSEFARLVAENEIEFNDIVKSNIPKKEAEKICIKYNKKNRKSVWPGFNEDKI